MKEILRHIVWMTILVSWALLSASCRGGEVSYTDEVQPDDDTATSSCVPVFLIKRVHPIG